MELIEIDSLGNKELVESIRTVIKKYDSKINFSLNQDKTSLKKRESMLAQKLGFELLNNIRRRKTSTGDQKTLNNREETNIDKAKKFIST